MSILIKGMEMPKERPQLLWVYPNGKALTVQSDVDPWKELQAVPVPPHGRLIDADEVISKVESILGNHWSAMEIKRAPTVIQADCMPIVKWRQWNSFPAEGKGYILAPQEEYDGLKRKYVVLKSDNGECVENCFVLRPDKDQAAIAALNEYASATENQVLAADIRKWLSTIIPASGGKEDE